MLQFLLRHCLTALYSDSPEWWTGCLWMSGKLFWDGPVVAKVLCTKQLVPGYLSPFTRVADLPSPASRRSLRSVGANRLVVPTSRLATVGSRAFPVAGPQTWNDLPEDVTSAESLSIFRRLLKTHLFMKSFPDYLLDISWLSPVDLAVVPLLRPPKNCLIDW